MWKIALVFVVLFLSSSCGVDGDLAPDEVVKAVLDAQENRNARLLVSYLSQSKANSLESHVEDIRNGDPNRILDFTGIELDESEIRTLDAKTLYILSVEAHWDVMDRMNLQSSGPEYLIGEPRISGDSALVDVTERYNNGEEIYTWVFVRENDRWRIDSYHGP